MNINTMTVKELLALLKEINTKNNTPYNALYLFDDGSGAIGDIKAALNPVRFIYIEGDSVFIEDED